MINHYYHVMVVMRGHAGINSESTCPEKEDLELLELGRG